MQPMPEPAAHAGLVDSAAEFLRRRLPAFDPGRAVAVVLGTGLGRWADALEGAVAVPYAEIPGFPAATVQGHAGALMAGTLAGKPVLALSGRFHLYEGYEPWQVVFGVRALGRLGVTTLMLTNAAGALNPQFDAGTLMLVADHINATGASPLRGPNVDAWGVRFPDMSRVYDTGLRELAMREAARLSIRLERGVYVQVLGPQLETPAETRACKRWGADAIGMSTVMEAIAARHMGLRVLAVSCLTNKNLPDCMAETSLEEVIAMAEKSAGNLGRLLAAVIAGM